MLEESKPFDKLRSLMENASNLIFVTLVNRLYKYEQCHAQSAVKPTGLISVHLKQATSAVLVVTCEFQLTVWYMKIATF